MTTSPSQKKKKKKTSSFIWMNEQEKKKKDLKILTGWTCLLHSDVISCGLTMEPVVFFPPAEEQVGVLI